LSPLDEFPEPPRADSDVEALSPEEEEELEEQASPISSPLPQIAKITQVIVYFKTCHPLRFF
jgi:hypothetical protein